MKIGFIGMGQMGTALCRGFIASGRVSPKDIYAYAPNISKLEKNSIELGFTMSSSLKDLCKSSDIIIFACKPNKIHHIVDDIREELKNKPVISIVLGYSYNELKRILEDTTRIQFVMPNIACKVLSAVSVFEEENTLKEEEREFALELFRAVGTVIVLETSLLKIGGVIAGCTPAFMSLVIEAYADAAVKYGIDRNTAYEMVSKSMEGVARLQLETNEHPAKIKDAICSPSGATIKGITALERAGLRSACQSSVEEIMS